MKAGIRFTVYRRKSSPNWYLELFHPTEGRQDFSLRTKNRREADRKAGAILREIEEGRWAKKHRTEWTKFCEQYLRESTDGMAESSVKDVQTTLKKLEKICNPQTVQQVNQDMLADFRTGLPEQMAKRTVAKHLRNLKKMLRWAEKRGMLPKAPPVDMPKGSSTPKAKGRAITAEELDRILAKAVAVVGRKSAPSFKHLLRGLFASGLRLGEALQLSWEQDSGFIAVDLYRKHPMYLIPADTDKSRMERLLPIAPEFVEMLEAVPEEERSSRVFKLLPQRNLGDLTRVDTVSSHISAMGRTAGVRVSQKKYASAHDLRRSFGVRWVSRVRPKALQQMMRHTSLQTTMGYYADEDADDTAAAMWDAVNLQKNKPNAQAKASRQRT